MRSVTTAGFRKAYQALPASVKKKAKDAYKRWKKDPFHVSLNFKQIHNTLPIFSVRIGLSYRALGRKEKNTLIWFWIGSHEDYNNLIKQI
ncbi:MAG: hypothetical protein KF845_14880 [Cyclobacteriaceae bacterium]|nr:hypothetical protein [Cyclobacteriaceae bacterium]